MAISFFSPNWHRVADLKPRLRAHVQFHRQVFRGAVWHVVQDNLSGRFHRLNEATHRIVCMMDGTRTVEEIWVEAGRLLGDEQPTQDDVIRLLGLLHNADLIFGGVAPHMDELAERSTRMRRRDFWSRVKNPLSMRFRFFDPDRFLTATLPFVSPILTRWGFAAWALLIVAGSAVAAVQFDAMAGSVIDHALSAQSMVIMLIAYPFIKAIHELGHAWVTKKWGGEVHELGVMVLIFMPVPFVDASASAGFPDPIKRALVGAAGIMVEMAVAALAVVVWSLAEPGLLRAVALNVAVIGGASTLLFNGNPLLRFDGYYVLCDLIEIPNLAQRANRFVFHWIQSRVFAIPDLETPVTAPGEARWFAFYAVASFVYRTMVMLGIALSIAGHYFFFGVLFALVSLAGLVVWPLVEGIRFLLADPRLAGRRGRAQGLTAAAVAVAALLVLAVPLPHGTTATGVVWVEEQDATVRARVEGIVAEIHPDEDVTPGTVVVRMEDPVLAARAKVAERQLEELEIRLEAMTVTDRAQANILREQIRNAEGQLADMRRDLAALSITADATGRFQPIDASDGVGRFHRRGDVVGHVVRPGGLVVRAVVPQTEIDFVRNRTRAVDVRLAGDAATPRAATIARDVPAALSELPHMALATPGGGPILIDTTRQDRIRPLETVFEVDVRVDDLPPGARLGMRAHVRFEHPPEPIGLRIARALRQIFLRQFNV